MGIDEEEILPDLVLLRHPDVSRDSGEHPDAASDYYHAVLRKEADRLRSPYQFVWADARAV